MHRLHLFANKKANSPRVMGALITLGVIALLLLSGPATAFDLQLGTPSDTTPTQGDSITFTASAEIIANEIVPIQNLSLDFSDGTVCYFSVEGDILTPDDCTGITITLEDDTTNYTSGDLNFTAAGTNYSYGAGFGYGYVSPGPSQISYDVTLDTGEFARGDLSFTLNAHMEGDTFTSDEKSINIKKSSGGSGGSGGGGSSITANPSTSQMWNLVNTGGAQIMKISTDDFGIKEITFAVSNSANGVKVIIEKLPGKPADIMQNISGKVFKYLKITKVNLDDTNINGMIKIKFQVAKSWLAANGIDAAQIVLKRYVNNAWVDLTTTLLSTDNTYAYYEAETPGFSYFAIAEGTAIVPTAPVPKAPETPVTEPVAKQSGEELAAAEQPPVTIQPSTEDKTKAPETQKPSDIATFVFMLVIVLALVIGVIAITKGRRKRRSRFKTLQNE